MCFSSALIQLLTAANCFQTLLLSGHTHDMLKKLLSSRGASQTHSFYTDINMTLLLHMLLIQRRNNMTIRPFWVGKVQQPHVERAHSLRRITVCLQTATEKSCMPLNVHFIHDRRDQGPFHTARLMQASCASVMPVASPSRICNLRSRLLQSANCINGKVGVAER